jgi:hypothetical protein
MDHELEKKLGTTIPVCPRCYITAILELDSELQNETAVEP